MNVNNFFKFIGDKFPQYHLSSDNEQTKNMFYKSYQKTCEADENDGELQFSLPLPVPGESTIDANGKNGKFIQVGMDGEYYTDPDGYRDYEYKKFELHSNYKNDKRVGNSVLYSVGNKISKNTYKNDDTLKKIQEYAYDNGKISQKIYYHHNWPYKSSNDGPFISQVAHYDENGEIVAIDRYRMMIDKETGLSHKIVGSNLAMRTFYKKDPNKRYSEQMGHITLDKTSEDRDKPKIYYDLNGNEISEEEYHKISSYI